MRIENARVENYRAILNEPSRPPSQGGNGNAWHIHVLTIDGETYSFLTPGRRQWVFRRDTVSFDWHTDERSGRRYIDEDTIETRDVNGQPVIRGSRGWKPRRTAAARLPASRREQRD